MQQYDDEEDGGIAVEVDVDGGGAQCRKCEFMSELEVKDVPVRGYEKPRVSKVRKTRVDMVRGAGCRLACAMSPRDVR